MVAHITSQLKKYHLLTYIVEYRGLEQSGVWSRVEYEVWSRVEYGAEWSMKYGGEWSMEQSGVWSVEYGKYGLFPLVEYESESGVNTHTCIVGTCSCCTWSDELGMIIWDPFSVSFRFHKNTSCLERDILRACTFLYPLPLKLAMGQLVETPVSKVSGFKKFQIDLAKI